VTGVASFYHFFTFVPRGKHKLAVCLGTACFVKGRGWCSKDQRVVALRRWFNNRDRMFSLDVARCVGAARWRR